jgi:hypothetical protein
MLDKFPVRYDNRRISFNIAMLGQVGVAPPGGMDVRDKVKTTIKF